MIRIANINDAEAIALLGRITFLEAHQNSTSKEEMDTYLESKFNKSSLEIELSDEANVFYLYFENEQLAGYSKIILNSPAPIISDITNVCKLERLYISSKFYGKKIGLKLFQFNLNICSENQQSAMWLTVWTENERAISFYEKANFKTIGEVMFKVGNQYNPNLVMWLSL